MIRHVLLLLPLLAASPVLAQSTDCARAAAPAEREICADPILRATDAELGRLFATLRGEAPSGVRATLVAGQRAWLAQRNCAGACLIDRIAVRRDALRALAATVSPANPGPDTAIAVWLVGRYRAGPLRGLAGLRVPDSVPGMVLPGTELRFAAGSVCEGDACGDFGLIPQRLASGPGQDTLPALLDLPATAPAWLVLRDGQAGVLLAPASGGTLIALASTCAPTGGSCGWAVQDWTRLDGYGMREVDLSKP